MRVITIRNIPPDLQRKLDEEAAATGASMARTVIRLLLKATDLPPSRSGAPYADLDELAGTWSVDEAEEFDKALAEQRRIDPDIWG